MLRKYSHNSSRVEALSDAVFAFAATLLVVSVDSNPKETLMQVDWVMFLSFAISFFALFGLWTVHYNFFRRTKYVDNWILALNTILLFLVLYFIFPIKSLINKWVGNIQLNIEDFSSLFQLYSLGFLLIFSCYSLMYWRVFRKAKNSGIGLNAYFYARHFGIFVVVALISILIAKLKIGLYYGFPGMIYMLLGPLCYFHSIRFEKKYRAY